MDKLIEITLDNGRKIKVNKDTLDECPECKENSVRAKQLEEGGGVVCINKDCHYWFCF